MYRHSNEELVQLMTEHLQGLTVALSEWVLVQYQNRIGALPTTFDYAYTSNAQIVPMRYYRAS